mmetsp:Transcript_27623/g.45884  ORF Transcript_27623/g.45884 Transcript_27623/m.45884 type:complete len:245 (+) Transcript_27623:140-874(+)
MFSLCQSNILHTTISIRTSSTEWTLPQVLPVDNNFVRDTEDNSLVFTNSDHGNSDCITIFSCLDIKTRCKTMRLIETARPSIYPVDIAACSGRGAHNAGVLAQLFVKIEAVHLISNTFVAWKILRSLNKYAHLLPSIVLVQWNGDGIEVSRKPLVSGSASVVHIRIFLSLRQTYVKFQGRTFIISAALFLFEIPRKGQRGTPTASDSTCSTSTLSSSFLCLSTSIVRVFDFKQNSVTQRGDAES